MDYGSGGFGALCILTWRCLQTQRAFLNFQLFFRIFRLFPWFFKILNVFVCFSCNFNLKNLKKILKCCKIDQKLEIKNKKKFSWFLFFFFRDLERNEYAIEIAYFHLIQIKSFRNSVKICNFPKYTCWKLKKKLFFMQFVWKLWKTVHFLFNFLIFFRIWWQKFQFSVKWILKSLHPFFYFSNFSCSILSIINSFFLNFPCKYFNFSPLQLWNWHMYTPRTHQKSGQRNG